MKRIPAWLLPFVLVACGGGGGGGNGGNNNGAPNPLVQAALELLEDCAADPIGTFESIIDTVRAFPSSSLPPITIGDPNGLEIPFNATPSAPVPELIGVFTFEDAGGTQIMPFTAGDLQGDVQNLVDGIANLPDGTKVTITIFAVPSISLDAGSLTQTMNGGLATDVEGLFRTTTGSCVVEVSFANETILSLLGEYPNLTADIMVTRNTDNLDGSVFFNGTSTAVIEVSINGTGPFQFEIDLDTGVVSSAD